MSSSTPRETTGALPEWSGIQKTDKNMIIDPILQQYRAVMRAALQEHMNLVTSQYMTGYARASRESGIGAAMPMDPPNLSDISDVNPVTTPDQTPKTKSRLAAYAGIVPSPTSFSSVASLAKRRAAPNDEDNEPEPEPEGRNIDPTMAKELWERSATDSNAEVAKGWAMLINQLQTAGNMLAEELWDKAAVTISKRNQQAFESTKETTDPEVTAALRKHKTQYAGLIKDLSRVYAQSAETATRVQKAMVVVQELAVKVGDLGDVDESAHNSVDALKTSKPCDTELDSEQKAEWEEKIRNAQEYADTARRESEAMTQRLEAAQKKQTAQEFVQRSYVASQLTALKAILSIKDADATDHKSKIAQPVSLVTNMKQLLGDLDPAKLCTQPGPLNAVRLKETLTALLHTCPVGMSAIAGPLHQVMEQSGFQHLKVPPACLYYSGMDYDHPNRKKDPVTKHWSREYFNNYVSQSKEVFTLLSRHLHDALTWCDKTCPLSSTDKHRACEGDIVSAVFIILDLNEKSGWTERNTKREFYAHAHTIVGSEKSLRHALDIIRKTLAEAKRIRVKIEYEVVRRVATMIQRREPTLINVTQKYNIDPVGPNAQYQYDALPKLEELLAETDYECEKLGVMTDLTVNYCTDQQLSDLNAHAVKAFGNDWNSDNRHDNNNGGGGKGNGSGNGGDNSSNLVCAIEGCSNKLSKAGDKSARAVAAKTNTDVTKHKHCCTHHFKIAIKDKLDGGKGQLKLKSGQMYTIPSRTKAYKAMKASIVAARAKVENPAAEPEPAKEEKGETTEPKSEASVSFSIEMTADEYFEYRTTKEAAEKRATFSADQ